MCSGPPKLEVCVDSVAGVDAAISGGADRVELCSALSEGGLTPSAGLMTYAATKNVPCLAMIRPRAGGFIYSSAEVKVMLHDIDVVREIGLAGVVFGVQGADGGLDQVTMRILLNRAEGLGTTLHRVIDCVPDPVAEVASAKALGFDRILTSGGKASAVQGAFVIRDMVKAAGHGMSIMPGSGLTAACIEDVAEITQATEFHASCRTKIADGNPECKILGAAGNYITNEDQVREISRALLGR